MPDQELNDLKQRVQQLEILMRNHAHLGGDGTQLVGLTKIQTDITQRPIDIRHGLASIFPLTGAAGTVTDPTSFPPVDIYDQYRIYTSGATKRFYWYDYKGGTWGFVTSASGVLATNATTGFSLIPTCAGTPTGVPVIGNGAMVYDTTNNKLYVYNGAWKGVTLT